MMFHLISGDAMVDLLRGAELGGELIVCRECLIDGPITATGDDFWESRAAFLAAEYDAGRDDYFQRVAGEFRRLNELKPSDDLTLWFGDDLFCQFNMWFASTIFGKRGARVFRAFPRSLDFGKESPTEIRNAFEDRVELDLSDLELASNLWESAVAKDGSRMIELGRSESSAFRNLDKATIAAAELRTRPQTILRQLNAEFEGDFVSIFGEFSKREAIYGFGDSQVKRLLDGLL